MARRLGDMALGSTIKLNENGVPVEFYVAKHDYESSLNGTGRTLIVRKDCYDKREWHTPYSGNRYATNKYDVSQIDSWLNGTYRNLLDSYIRELIGTTTFYYTDYQSDEVKPLSRSIFLLSSHELGFAGNNQTYLSEGSTLQISKTLAIACYEGAAVNQWTRTRVIGNTEEAIYVYDTGASVYWEDVDAAQYGSRPVFTLPATLSVNDSGSVFINTAPVIASATADGTNLGTKNTGFNFVYSVDDTDGDSITVSEYLDNVLKRSYVAVSGVPNTFECVTTTNYQKILNGDHTLKVIANDGVEDSDPYVVTFTKKVTTASITMETPVTTDSQITVMTAGIVGSLPDDVVVEVLVTNNAKDSTPVWENATESILKGENHVFTNKSAANGFAFNFKLTVSRGASDVGGYVNSFGGELGNV